MYSTILPPERDRGLPDGKPYAIAVRLVQYNSTSSLWGSLALSTLLSLIGCICCPHFASSAFILAILTGNDMISLSCKGRIPLMHQCDFMWLATNMDIDCSLDPKFKLDTGTCLLERAVYVGWRVAVWWGASTIIDKANDSCLSSLRKSRVG